MAEPRQGPPPVPPRVDLGETEDTILNSQEHVADDAKPHADFNGSQTAKYEPDVTPKNNKPLVTPKKFSNPSPDILKPTNNVPPPLGSSTKPMSKKETKSRPTISIISARPMDQTSSLVQFKNDKTETTTQGASVNNNQPSVNAEAIIAEDPKHPPQLNKPSRPAPKKPLPKHEDRVSKPVDMSKKTVHVPNQRSKTRTTKRDSGSVFYIDTSTDNGVDTGPLSVAANSSKTVQKTRAAPQPNVKSKPTLPAQKKPKTKEKASEVDVLGSTKVEPPEKAASKPKLKPTIITAKTRKPQGKAEEIKISSSQNMNTSNVTKTVDDDRPSRPSFPPSASTDEMKANESQPERPKAPPNDIKEEQREVEKKREQKNSRKTEQSEKKRPKSKPTRPPMTKESTRLKPTRPPSAKPNVARTSPSKAKDVSDKTNTGKSTFVKPSGPPRAQAKFDYSGETEEDLAFKAGDTIMLISKVDDDWLVGYLENNVMHQGLFPSSFVDIIVALEEQPNKEPTQNKKEIPSESYAIALHDFQGQSEAELSFSAGETITLLERVNVEWLKGKIKNAIGIFPANFVEIQHDLPSITNEKQNNCETFQGSEEWCQAIHDYKGEQAGDLSFVVGTKIKITEKVSQDWFKGECSGKSGIFPASFVQVISESGKESEEFSLVTAEHDYRGENSDDLSFKAGDKIKVIERVNLDWLMGECNGKRGLFPASFVNGLHNESSLTIQTSSKEIQQNKETRTAKAIHEFAGENPGELHFNVGDVIQIIREVDSNWSEGNINNISGIFPTVFVEMQPLLSKDNVHAKALYDFAGESEHDLPFKAGDTIQVLEHVNDDWWSGSINGKTGHFPSSFVQILSSR